MSAGYQVKTSDGVVGTSGTPKIIYSLNWTSGGTAGEVKMYDGTGTGGTLVHDETGTINKGTYTPFGGYQGVTLKNGCYLDIDANVVQVTVVYQEVI